MIFKKIRWFWQEAFSQKTLQHIYNDLIRQKKYEQSVDYRERVKSLGQALKQFSVQEFPTVLDLACGTGAVIESLTDIQKRMVTGIDISPQMLSVAAQRFSSYPQVRFRQMDLMDMLLLPDNFDLITLANASRFIPQDQSQEFSRLVYHHLKPHGRFFVSLHRSIIQTPLVWAAACLGKKMHFNMKLAWAKYFIAVMQDYFEVEQEIFLLRKHILIDSVALIMRKKL